MLERSEPTMETWKIEQARQALDVYQRRCPHRRPRDVDRDDTIATAILLGET